MKSIIQFKLSHLRNDEHIFFHTEVLKAFTPEIAAKYGIAPQRGTYRLAFDKEEGGYKPKLSYAATEEIAKADQTRDEIDLYLKNDIANKRRSPLPEVREAANTIWHEVLPYAESNRLNYDSNTAQITKMVNVLLLPENKALTDKMGNSEIVELLATANSTFLDIYNRRSEEEFQRGNAAHMKTSRPLTDDGYREATEALVILYQANELVAKDETTRAELGAVIDAINTIIAHRKKVLAARGDGTATDIDSAMGDSAEGDSSSEGGSAEGNPSEDESSEGGSSSSGSDTDSNESGSGGGGSSNENGGSIVG